VEEKMATRIADVRVPVVVNAKAVPLFSTDGFRRHASWGLSAAGWIFLLGTVLDLGILWVFQRQEGAQFEFTALASTAEGLPRIVLAVALLYAGLYVGGSTSLIAFRLLGLLLIGVALLGAVVGALMLTDYFVLRRDVTAEALWIFRSTTVKTLALCAMYVMILVPVGALGMRRPRT
jgi:hypothetical protein